MRRIGIFYSPDNYIFVLFDYRRGGGAGSFRSLEMEATMTVYQKDSEVYDEIQGLKSSVQRLMEKTGLAEEDRKAAEEQQAQAQKAEEEQQAQAQSQEGASEQPKQEGAQAKAAEAPKPEAKAEEKPTGAKSQSR
jgi:DNA segregation ATPase FtsK/SpoIIIE-like protein